MRIKKYIGVDQDHLPTEMHYNECCENKFNKSVPNKIIFQFDSAFYRLILAIEQVYEKKLNVFRRKSGKKFPKSLFLQWILVM